MTNLATTQEITIPASLLDSVYPEIRCRPEHVESTPAERIAYAVDAAEIRQELASTQEMPAIEDDGPRMVECSDCRGAGEYYVGGRDRGNGPDAGRIVTCYTCGGAGEVDEDAI